MIGLIIIALIFIFIIWDYNRLKGKYDTSINVERPSNSLAMDENIGSNAKKDPTIFTTFKVGENYYFNNELEKALKCFDECLEAGFIESYYSQASNFYEFRAACLQGLGYHYEAIDNFGKAIFFNADNCNNYFSRSISKGAILDYKGEIDDLNKAIELSKKDTPLNYEYNDEAKRMGYSSTANMYHIRLMLPKMNLESEERNECKISEATTQEQKDSLKRSFDELKQLKLSRIRTR